MRIVKIVKRVNRWLDHPIFWAVVTGVLLAEGLVLVLSK